MAANREPIDSNQHSSRDEAIYPSKKTSTAKFHESIDIANTLGTDAKKSDQNVRGTLLLQNGTGKTLRVIVFAQSEQVDAAKNAGADKVGFEDLAEEIKSGFSEFDVVISTPDTMRIV